MPLVRMLAAALVALFSVPAAAQAPFAWPGGREAAIVLTYDDAAPTHLANAVPQLDEVGLKGTFFLNARFDAAGVDGWRAAAAHGHELGNHTLFHPCPKGSFDMDRHYESEGYTIHSMLEEVRAMNAFLYAIDGRKGPRTMGIPCGPTLAGGVDYLPELRKSGMIRYVRNDLTSATGIADPRTVDPFQVATRSFPETATAADLIAFVEQVRAQGRIGVILFHGVGGDWLTTSNEAHRGLLRYLKDHQDKVWTAPFGTVMDHVMAARGK